jgi:hypothetical protein
MYIRWKYYSHSDRSRSLRPEIVESYRDVLTREPRNRTLRYLGSFRERDISNPKVLYLYWRLIDEKLSLLRLSPKDEQSVRDRLAERIPRVVGGPPLREELWKESTRKLVNYDRPQINLTSKEGDAESPSVAELERCLTELMRRVG